MKVKTRKQFFLFSILLWFHERIITTKTRTMTTTMMTTTTTVTTTTTTTTTKTTTTTTTGNAFINKCRFDRRIPPSPLPLTPPCIIYFLSSTPYSAPYLALYLAPYVFMMNWATYLTPSQVSSPEGMMPEAGSKKPGFMVFGRHSKV